MKVLGYVRVELEGYFIERFINLCTKEKINIWNIKKEKEIKIFFNVNLRDYKKIIPICKKTKCRIKIKKKIGLPFFIHRYKKRKIFIILLIILSISIYISSMYIWNIDILIDESKYLDNIEKDLNELGLKNGKLKKDINVNEIISKIKLKRDDISWIGIEIKGTNATVRIKKAEKKPKIIDNSEYCNIIASKSGTITKIIAQNGTSLVKVGDKVEKGDILIAGFIEGKYTGKRLVHSMRRSRSKN